MLLLFRIKDNILKKIILNENDYLSNVISIFIHF